tara:strand:- start:13427 stop:14662 length:1236 start_codon:yes stop_codon:yes gene_type:complete
MGIYIFGFRIGELAMGFSLLIFIFSMVTFYSSNIFNNSNKKIFFITFFLISITFIVNVFIYGNSISTYTFRSSSYIWTTGFLFFGYQFFRVNTLSKNLIYVGIPILIYIYFFSIYGFPQTIIDFILSISDKFEPHKGSDLLIIYVTIVFVVNKLFMDKRRGFEIFILLTSLYFPLMLFKSRASFIAFLFFSISELYYFRNNINSNYKRNLLLIFLVIFIFFQSVFFVSGSGFIKADEIEAEVEYVATYRNDPDDEKFRLFYIAEDTLGSRTTRIFSSDNNLNWRLQIWQDVIYDLLSKNKLILGYGYEDKIPAMLDEGRSGLDRLNENVHNYVVTLLARGGITTVILYSLLYFMLIKTYKDETKSNYFLIYLIPVLFNSLFDVAMENSHFPLIFYFFSGMLFHKNKIFNNY